MICTDSNLEECKYIENQLKKIVNNTCNTNICLILNTHQKNKSSPGELNGIFSSLKALSEKYGISSILKTNLQEEDGKSIQMFLEKCLQAKIKSNNFNTTKNLNMVKNIDVIDNLSNKTNSTENITNILNKMGHEENKLTNYKINNSHGDKNCLIF